MKPKVLVYMRVDERVIETLKKDFEVTCFQNHEYLGDPAFDSALKEADGIIGLALKVTKELLDAAPNLKIVCNVSVGYDNLDLDEISKRNILATNTPEVLNDTTADAIFGLLIATARRIPELDHVVKSGGWNISLQPDQYGVDVHHKTLGIIGMGSIGSAIAKRAHFGFDMNILYHNRSRNKKAEQAYQATYCELNELLERSDFVCLMVPATKETANLMGREQFQRMKKTAIFINGSRGKNVDEQALYEALKTGNIHAAGIDVFKEEPTPKDNPLLKLKNIVTLPHIGSSTTECEYNMSKLAAENLKDGLNGKMPPSLLN
ncbi:2-hydroxyacid dehydrogenase [Halalkalibacter akibai]|uniref:Glyoxylate/hydroxypyruvate reductase B n=1 Tax=Halalkalibacter akibai (strain ATCC 43226 / DSM 21942 / CIP 109018 / JCM 9157 / 1139) TaxID=1236973 RepID=W4QSL6_HALA3|nr:D-glycerate dehydrogenase [Halalkalibacter akibai]GAE34324.1 glyoxylate reductase [Halalkalibacter akibai JCM 9157]